MVRYRIWAGIAGVVALAGLVNFFRWAARYDGAIVIPFLVIGGLALCWWYRRTLKERLARRAIDDQEAATLRLCGGDCWCGNRHLRLVVSSTGEFVFASVRWCAADGGFCRATRFCTGGLSRYPGWSLSCALHSTRLPSSLSLRRDAD